MNDIIQTLNHCSADRTIFYCIIFLISLSIVTSGVVNIFRAISNTIKKIK